MPADVDAPDKVVYGLTFRQLAILAVAALAGYSTWRSLHTMVPPLLLAAVGLVAGALVFATVVGRRDGLTMDRWLLAAVRHARAPHALSTTDTAIRVPAFVPTPSARTPIPAPLRLPADAIGDDGRISVAGGSAVIVAATTVNLALRTPGEQTAVIEGFGRWLNSLSERTQILVSGQPFDLHAAADSLTRTAGELTHPALADACRDHAAFLADLGQRRDPLQRQVLIVTRNTAAHAALRRADDTVRALSGLGVTVRPLDGPAATTALAAAADAYRTPRPVPLAVPQAVITAAPPPPTRRRPS
ncbi:PrgI family protein [Asanoa sp. NPDC049518]|uniref:PrgI family protein n=1 Tax=unclassified Asanoa TaxID=2685164 RepID=UPI00344AA627